MLRPTILLLATVSMSAFGAEESALHWQRTDSTVSLQRGDQVVWRFNHGAQDTKPCFHPLALDGGPNLTWFRPADHPWHRSLWFSWKFINGVNYWEEDKATGQSAGRTETLNTRIENRPDFSARITQQLHYRPGTNHPVLAEERVIEVTAPAADGSYSMDWTMTFKALDEVLLDRTPLPHEPGGQVFGGYAGLSIRLVRELADVQAVTTAGPAAFASNRFRGKSPFLDYSGNLGGREVGVAVIDHPQNLNAPSPWYAINDPVMRYFSPAVICYGAHKMKSGESFTLRYRVILHPGRWDVERLEKASAKFAGGH